MTQSSTIAEHSGILRSMSLIRRLLLVIALSAFVACGGSADTPTAPTTAFSPEAAATRSADGPTGPTAAPPAVAPPAKPEDDSSQFSQLFGRFKDVEFKARYNMDLPGENSQPMPGILTWYGKGGKVRLDMSFGANRSQP